MSSTEYTKESTPRPRLMHIQPGQYFTLASRHEDGPRFPTDSGRKHLMIRRCDKYAHYKDVRGGDAKVGLYHEVFPEDMSFAQVGGWRKRDD